MPSSDGRGSPVYLAYRFGQLAASSLPESLLIPAAERLGVLAGRRNTEQREVVRRNLARVVTGDVEAVVDQAYRCYARYWVETLRIPKPGTDEIRRRTTSEGLERLAALLDAGRSVIFVSGHIGSYDVAGAWLASHGWRVMAIAEEVKPPALFDMFVSLRRSVGIEVFPLGKGSSARALLTGLREGVAVGLVADRDISGSGIGVEFLGETTKLPDGPAILALRTGTPIAVGALYQRPRGRFHAVVLDPIEVEPGKADPQKVREITEAVTRQLEELIRREPGQWHLFQPNWPSDPGYRWAT